MNRESDLTQLRLKWVESELSEVRKFGIWVESELSQSRKVKCWVESELSHLDCQWVRVESAWKIWVEYNPDDTYIKFGNWVIRLGVRASQSKVCNVKHIKNFTGNNAETIVPRDVRRSESCSEAKITLWTKFHQNRKWSGEKSEKLVRSVVECPSSNAFSSAMHPTPLLRLPPYPPPSPARCGTLQAQADPTTPKLTSSAGRGRFRPPSAIENYLTGSFVYVYIATFRYILYIK